MCLFALVLENKDRRTHGMVSLLGNHPAAPTLHSQHQFPMRAKRGSFDVWSACGALRAVFGRMRFEVPWFEWASEG